MLKVILNKLNSQAETIIAEEQAGFRAGRSTCEQIFNLRVMCEKYAHHQQHVYNVFMDFKKEFDRVWHVAVWTTISDTTSYVQSKVFTTALSSTMDLLESGS